MKRPDHGADTPSKSQLKRDAKTRRDLGRRLVGLPDSLLLDLPLDADVLEAVRLCRTIRSRAARKRQLGYLGGLLRNRDVAPLLEALDRQGAGARQAAARQHRVEAWRDALIERGDRLLADLVARRDATHVQELRQLMLGARREHERGKPPASARKLFRLLREMDEQAPLPPLPEET